MGLHDILKRQTEGMSISSDNYQKDTEGLFVECKGVRLYRPEYEILESIASETGRSLDELSARRGFRVEIDEDGRINYLALCGYKFGRIPESVSKLTYLQGLSLGSNNITKVHGLDKLVNLEKLFLHINLISEIEGLDGLNKLKRVCLINNPIDLRFNSYLKTLRTNGVDVDL